MHRRVVFIVVLCFFVSVDGFGFPTTPCACAKRPLCPPPPPPPLPCPPPPVYQPCPPAPIYQPPPPCPPVEPVAPPPPPVTPPPFSPLPSVNNCCHKCAAPCYYQPRIALGAKIFQAGYPIRSHRKIDEKCNSEELRKIMRLGMIGETRYSKRAIQRLAEEKLGGQFSVICSAGDFSYVVDTSYYCLETYNNLTCYAFQLEEN